MTRTRPEQAALSSESERFQQLDAAFAKAATPSDRTEARDELVNFSRELVAIARDPKLGKLGNDPAASKEMVNSLIDTMSARYGMDSMQFIGPGGNIDAFPDALREKLDAGR